MSISPDDTENSLALSEDQEALSPVSSDLSEDLALDLAIAEGKEKEEADKQEAINALKAAEVAAAADEEEAAIMKVVQDADAIAAKKAKSKNAEKSAVIEIEDSDSDSAASETSKRDKKKQAQKRKRGRPRKDNTKEKADKQDKGDKSDSAEQLEALELGTPKSKIRYRSVVIDEFGQFQNDNLLKLLYLKKPDFDKLDAAAAEKNPGAMLDLAACYRYGYCNLKVNMDMAFDYLLKVIESSDPDCVTVAKWILSTYYYENLCTQTQVLPENQRLAQALQYIKVTANAGLAVAINNLGHYYENTETLPDSMLAELVGPQQGPKSPDEIRSLRFQKAYELFEKAAYMKLNHAEYNLAQCFCRESFYVPEKLNNKADRKKHELYWLLRAVHNNYHFAKDHLAAHHPDEYAKYFKGHKNKSKKGDAEKVAAADSAIALENVLDKERTVKRKRWDHDILEPYKYKKRKTLHRKVQGKKSELLEEDLKKLRDELFMLPEGPLSRAQIESREQSKEKSKDLAHIPELPDLSSIPMSITSSLQEGMTDQIAIISGQQLKQIEHLKRLNSALNKETAEDEQAIKELEEKLAKLDGKSVPPGAERQKDVPSRKFI